MPSKPPACYNQIPTAPLPNDGRFAEAKLAVESCVSCDKGEWSFMPSRELPDKEEESLERKAGRLLFVGLPVTRLDRHWRELLREVRPGGVILFGRNIESAEQVALLNAQIRDAAGDHVFIGVDQEGGLVDRFRDICEPAPSAKAVRDAGVAELAERFGSLTARVLRLLGFNTNFAPVLDLSGANEENGLRARTFGPGPEMVSLPAGASLDGLPRGPVVAV